MSKNSGSVIVTRNRHNVVPSSPQLIGNYARLTVARIRIFHACLKKRVRPVLVGFLMRHGRPFLCTVNVVCLWLVHPPNLVPFTKHFPEPLLHRLVFQ